MTTTSTQQDATARVETQTPERDDSALEIKHTVVYRDEHGALVAFYTMAWDCARAIELWEEQGILGSDINAVVAVVACELPLSLMVPLSDCLDGKAVQS